MDVSLASFHDGFLDGVVVEDEVYLLLRTVEGSPWTLVARGVEEMCVWGFRSGNIILDLEVINAHEDSLSKLYDLPPAGREMHLARILGIVQDRGLRLLVLSSSYGAEGLILAERFELLPGKQKGLPERSPF